MLNQETSKTHFNVTVKKRLKRSLSFTHLLLQILISSASHWKFLYGLLLHYTKGSFLPALYCQDLRCVVSLNSIIKEAETRCSSWDLTAEPYLSMHFTNYQTWLMKYRTIPLRPTQQMQWCYITPLPLFLLPLLLTFPSTVHRRTGSVSETGGEQANGCSNYSWIQSVKESGRNVITIINIRDTWIWNLKFNLKLLVFMKIQITVLLDIDTLTYTKQGMWWLMF